MKLNINSLGWILAATLAVILFFKGCGKETKKITVTVPEESGEFEEQEPNYIDVGNIKIPHSVEFKGAKVETEYPTNDKLISKYRDSLELLNDSIKEIKRFEMFADAIQIKRFYNTFEDDKIKLEMMGRVQGDLLGITPKYTIKEREIDVEVETAKLRVLLGGGIGNNTSFSDFTYRANLGFQNAKGNILRGGWSKMRGEDYIFLEYDLSIFEIK